MYDIETAFKNSGLSAQEIEKIKREVRNEFPNDDMMIEKIKREVRNEFPNDDMMYELHIIRILKAVKKGYWKLDDS
jgi:hypothetical protein